ncbi:fungal-specific transcription factor domain-containing protein [Xylariaceae sp. FL0016]|nr:fungal-specific transcription factor domain-containing protein [Xylariaceae sp. FL0016]
MSSSSVPAPRIPRILACVLCQSRKIKCDRNQPCSNCVKSNVKCTPSTPAPARKRRRPNQDLQQRLARCEELLSDYATAKPQPSSSESPRDQDQPWKSSGKLIVNQEGVKFMDSYLWANIHDELSAMKDIIEDDETIDEFDTPTDTTSPEQNTAMLLSDSADVNLEDLHPEPAHVFRLWQTFLERVNPLTKIVHVPTVQPLLVEAATSRADIHKNVEALLFSIYLMGAVALRDDECIDLLGYNKEEAYARFSKGCRTALMRIGILKSYDLVVLQALVLYLFSLSGRYDRHAAWILNGITVRIAQKMGLHRDGEFLGLSPFDTEIRRRIWWQIVLLDAMTALMSGLGQNLLPRSWDTKKALNVNDSDLYPTMSSVQAKDGPTDMIYCLMLYEVARLFVDSPVLEHVALQNERGDTPPPAEVGRARARIDELDQTISEIFNKYGDLSMGPIHELATSQRPVLIAKLHELVRPLQEQPEWGTEIQTPKDNLFKMSVTTGEHNLRLYQTTQSRGFFLWFMMSHFQIEVLIYMVGQLSSRVQGQLVDRAWAVLEHFYAFHDELYDISVKHNLALAIFTTRAWRRREGVLQREGSSAETPAYILKLQSLVPSEEGKREAKSEPPQTGDATLNGAPVAPNADASWDQMLGFLDAGALDWDMFGSGSSAQATGNLGSFGTSFGNYSNGWA